MLVDVPQRCDTDGDGVLDRQEFGRLMYRNKEKKELERQREQQERELASKEKELGKMVRYELEIEEDIEEDINFNETVDGNDELEEIEEDLPFEIYTFLEEAGRESRSSQDEEIKEDIGQDSDETESVEELPFTL